MGDTRYTTAATIVDNNSKLILLNSINANQLSLKHKRRTTGDRANTTVTISILRGNSQGTLLADTHIKKTLVPATKTRVSTVQNQLATSISPQRSYALLIQHDQDQNHPSTQAQHLI